jgi:hypothetical protein
MGYIYIVNGIRQEAGLTVICEAARSKLCSARVGVCDILLQTWLTPSICTERGLTCSSQEKPGAVLTASNQK